jgi:two-component system sensor histidine kinase/response regulator
MDREVNRRILVIDDNVAIHADFQKTLGAQAAESASFADAESALFDEASSAPASVDVAGGFEVDFASQGKQGWEMLQAARAAGRPYALAFVDVRMPPGWDGVETLEKLWAVDGELQAVLCTAFADYTWQEMVGRLGRSDGLLILKKPFDPIEVRQMASALTEKWNSAKRERLNLEAAQRAESEALAYAASLETLNRALVTSRQAAESTAAAKSDLLRHLARRLFVPMERVLGTAEDLSAARSQNQEELLERLGELCREGGDLRKGLRDVLDLSELEAGTIQLECVEFSPRSVAAAAMESSRARKPDRALELRLECARDLPATSWGDPQRIGQILRHLVDNAMEVTPDHGCVRLVAGITGRDGPAEGELCFEVIDAGPGLSRDQEGLLFEPFGGGRAEEPARAGRIGLGLPVSKRVAQRLGGDLTLEHSDQGGSRFTLTVKSAAPWEHRSASAG